MGDDRDPRGSARGARHGRPPASPHARSRSSTTMAVRCRPGETGHIFVGHEMLFEGYTDGTQAEAR